MIILVICEIVEVHMVNSKYFLTMLSTKQNATNAVCLDIVIRDSTANNTLCITIIHVVSGNVKVCILQIMAS